MRVIFLLVVAFIMKADLNGQIIINEVNISGNWVELQNVGLDTIDISLYALCNRPRYRVVSATTDAGSNAGVQVISGSLNMAPGDYTVLGWDNISFHGTTTGELGLYEQIGGYTNVNNIQDYLQWGTGTPVTGRDGTAVNAGLWDSTSSFVAAPTDPNYSLGLIPSNYSGGTDTDSTDWEEQSPTQGAVNMSPSNCPIDLNITGIIPAGTYYASNNIMSDGIVSMLDTVMFVAGNEIMLNEGFEVELSAFFEASIGSCP